MLVVEFLPFLTVKNESIIFPLFKKEVGSMKKGLKKALSVALAAGMIVPMAACGSKGGSTVL